MFDWFKIGFELDFVVVNSWFRKAFGCFFAEDRKIFVVLNWNEFFRCLVFLVLISVDLIEVIRDLDLVDFEFDELVLFVV